MGTFSAMDIARTGMGFHRYWLDVISHNIANVNNAGTPGEDEAFSARFVVAGTNGDQIAPTGSGVHVAGVEESDVEGVLTYEPDHPEADENGLVEQSDVDMGGQMADMILAQRGYQMNARSVTSAKEAYEAALRIGDR